MKTYVSRCESDTAGYLHWTIHVQRTEHNWTTGGTPLSSDLPEDVREALLTWLAS